MARDLEEIPQGGGRDLKDLPAERSTSGPGEWTSLGRGAIQGALMGFGTEINGGAQALGQLLLPKAAGGDEGFHLGKLLENYRQARDSLHRENQAAQEAHPGWYLGGNLAGGIATSPLLMGSPLGATGWASIPGRMAGSGKGLYQLARTGAFVGGLNALGESNADLTKGWTGEDPNAGHEALSDFATGGAVGLSLPLLLKGAGWAGGKTLSALSGAMDSGAIATGRRVLTGGANLTNAAKKALTPSAVKQALQEKAISLFGTTDSAASKLSALRQAGGAALGSIENDIGEAGVQGKSVHAVADQLQSEGERLAKIRNAGAKVYLNEANELRALAPVRPDVTIGAEELRGLSRDEIASRLGAPGVAGDITNGAASTEDPSKLPIRQWFDIKRSLQEKAREGGAYQDISPKAAKRALKGVAAIVKRSIDDSVASQAHLAPEAAAAYGPINERLSNLIAAGDAADKAVNQAAKRNAVSLRDLLLGQIGSGVAGGVAGGYEGSKSGHGFEGATLGLVGGMLARRYGPSTLAAALYRGQGAPQFLSQLAISAPMQRALPLAMGRFGLEPLTLGQLASGDK